MRRQFLKQPRYNLKSQVNSRGGRLVSSVIYEQIRYNDNVALHSALF